jgi:periplasmic protein TonB
MFADSLLESPWADRSRRGWTTAISFAAQMLGLGILLALPLLYTEGLPALKLIANGVPLAPPPGEHQEETHRQAAGAHSLPSDRHVFAVPRELPTHGVKPETGEAVEEPIPCPTCVPGGTGETQTSIGLPGSVGPASPVIPVAPKPVAKPPITSQMMEGNLIYRVQPTYPALARSARIQGSVVLRAVISRGGTIENLQVLSGHPLLVKAAMDAVRQWRYRPYILNGEPVEVETQVTVNFLLNGN